MKDISGEGDQGREIRIGGGEADLKAEHGRSIGTYISKSVYEQHESIILCICVAYQSERRARWTRAWDRPG